MSAEVSHFESQKEIEETVFGLHVPVSDTHLMQGFEAIQELAKKLSTYFWQQPVVVLHKVEQFTILGQLRHQISFISFRSPLPPNLIIHLVDSTVQSLQNVRVFRLTLRKLSLSHAVVTL